MQLLSHYTSEDGLIGIARSQSLWATEFVALNDRMELGYAILTIREEALAQILPTVPEDLHNRVKEEEHSALGIDDIRKLVTESDGYGSIYVTSFARGRNEDEDQRGILTLWDRYTRNQGYCLQFKMAAHSGYGEAKLAS